MTRLIFRSTQKKHLTTKVTWAFGKTQVIIVTLSSKETNIMYISYYTLGGIKAVFMAIIYSIVYLKMFLLGIGMPN